MIYRPPIKVVNHDNCTMIRYDMPPLKKDNERIEKIKNLCKELNIKVVELEDPSEFQTKLFIELPYVR